MLVAIIFGGFENITIWQRFNLEILLEESGWIANNFFVGNLFSCWQSIFFLNKICLNEESGWGPFFFISDLVTTNFGEIY